MKKFKGIKRRKAKKNYGKVVVWILAGIMILSTAGFLMNDVNQTTSITYNGYAIESTTRGLQVEFDDAQVLFTYYPDSVDDLRPPANALQLVKNAKVVVTSYDVSVEDPSPFGGVQYQMENDFPGKYVVRALVNGENYTLPELGCANATAQAPVIYYQMGNTTGYHVEGACVIGTVIVGPDVIRLRDALVYDYHGVYNERN